MMTHCLNCGLAAKGSPMFKVVTQYRAIGKRGGYVLQWVGSNKPSYIVGPNSTCCWYKHKKDAVYSCSVHNSKYEANYESL